MSAIGGSSDEIVKALLPVENPSNFDKREIANEINNAFLALMSVHAPLLSEPSDYSSEFPPNDTVITITTNAVFQKLFKT